MDVVVLNAMAMAMAMAMTNVNLNFNWILSAKVIEKGM